MRTHNETVARYNPNQDATLFLACALALLVAALPAALTGATIVHDVAHNFEDGLNLLKEKGPGWLGLAAVSFVLWAIMMGLASSGTRQYIAEREGSPFM